MPQFILCREDAKVRRREPHFYRFVSSCLRGDNVIIMELYIETRTKNQAHIIDVKGEVDLYSSPMMREYIFKTIKQHPSQTIIVDFSHVTYSDSSGIATLVEGLRLAQQRNTRFKLVGLSQAVLEVFQLARLERVFDIYPTEEEALQSEK